MNEFTELIKAVNEVQKLGRKLRKLGIRVISVDVTLCIEEQKPSISLANTSFDELKTLNNWKTSTIPYSEKFNNDKEFVVLDGVEVFTLREREEEA